MNKKNIFQMVAAASILAILVSSLPFQALAATTLYADISASPNSGNAPLNGVDLTAVVSGDATGNVVYRFDCTTDGVWDLTQTLNSSTYTAVDLCNYPSAGNYTATIKVERENLAFQGAVAILVNSQTVAPTVDLKINGSDGTISVAYNTAATLSWTSTNATSCYAIGNWSGSKSLSGSESTGNLTSSTTYTITCTGNGGSASDTVGATVQSQSIPTVDLRINGYDSSTWVDYNTSATLSWTSSNANYCVAGSGWSGQKAVSGSESTGNLTSQTTYSITCYGAGGLAIDTVTAYVQNQQNLTVSLQAIPNSGSAPLNNVDLVATVGGTATGTINYKFDCTSDGIWDYTFYNLSDNPKTVLDACNYANSGTYYAKVRAERGAASPAEATAQITVGTASQDVSISKTVRNLSDNTAFSEIVLADPGEVIEFRIVATNNASTIASNIGIRDTLPEKMSYYGSLKVDNVSVSGDISTGLIIGDLAPYQTKTITFQATVASASNFSYGTTDLINTAIVYNTNLARTDSGTVRVIRTQVLGATTVSTGIFDSRGLWLSLFALAVLVLSYSLLLKSYLKEKVFVLDFNWFSQGGGSKTKKSDNEGASEKALAKMVDEIRRRENI
jgi:uncharacterized repeat protein (TIGR01451 family)